MVSSSRHFRRRLIRILASCVLPVAVSLCHSEDAPLENGFVFGEVTANILNVRARPSIRHEVVCQLTAGALVHVVQVRGNWLGIKAPEQSEAWIPAKQITDKIVTGEDVPVYSGPGTIFTAYATVSGNQSVDVLQHVDDKWVKIRPPANAIVWVHRNFVDLDQDAEKLAKISEPDDERGTLEQPRVAADDVSASKTDTDQHQSEIDKIEPIAVEPVTKNIIFIGTVKEIEKNGIVVPANKEHQPFQYTLAVAVNETYYPLAYLSLRDGHLHTWVWKKVKVTGFQQWMKGWPRPLIQVRSIEELEPK